MRRRSNFVIGDYPVPDAVSVSRSEVVVAQGFEDLAKFLRAAAPRWLNGSRSLARRLKQRSCLREAVRGRRRGIRHVDWAAAALAHRRGGQPSF